MKNKKIKSMVGGSLVATAIAGALTGCVQFKDSSPLPNSDSSSGSSDSTVVATHKVTFVEEINGVEELISEVSVPHGMSYYSYAPSDDIMNARPGHIGKKFSRFTSKKPLTGGIIEDTKLYALYSIETVELTFNQLNADGTVEVIVFEVVSGHSFDKNKIPSAGQFVPEDGYLTWDFPTDLDFNNVTSSYIIHTKIEFAKTRTVTYSYGDGLDDVVIVVNNNDFIDVNLIPPLTSDTAEYSYAWSLDLSNKLITEDVLVKLRKTQRRYTVKFFTRPQLENPQLLTTQTVVYGDNAQKVNPPTLVGYKFKSWDKGLDNITHDLELFPIFEKQQYTISFIDNGFPDAPESTPKPTYKPLTAEYGDSVMDKLPTFTDSPDAHYIRTWEFDYNLQNVTKDIIVRATYTRKNYQVEIKNDKSDTNPALTRDFLFEDSLDLSTIKLSKSGHILKEFTDGTSVFALDYLYKVTSDVVLWGVWTPLNLKIEFYDYSAIFGEYFDELNKLSFAADIVAGNKLSVADSKTAIDALKNIPGGYQFDGWITEFANESNPLYVNPTRNMRLRPRITKKVLKVAFDDGTGVLPTQSIGFEERVSAPTPVKKYGYKFTGWVLKDGTGTDIKLPGESSTLERIIADSTFIPEYEVINFSLSFKYNNESGNEVTYKKEFAYGTTFSKIKAGLLADPLFPDVTTLKKLINGVEKTAQHWSIDFFNDASYDNLPLEADMVLTPWFDETPDKSTAKFYYLDENGDKQYCKDGSGKDLLAPYIKNESFNIDDLIKAKNPLNYPSLKNDLRQPIYLFDGFIDNIYILDSMNLEIQLSFVKSQKRVTFLDTDGNLLYSEMEDFNLVFKDDKFKAPTKKGYTLTGWTSKGGDFNLNTALINADLVLTAKWVANEVSINLTNWEDSNPSIALTGFKYPTFGGNIDIAALNTIIDTFNKTKYKDYLDPLFGELVGYEINGQYVDNASLAKYVVTDESLNIKAIYDVHKLTIKVVGVDGVTNVFTSDTLLYTSLTDTTEASFLDLIGELNKFTPTPGYKCTKLVANNTNFQNITTGNSTVSVFDSWKKDIEVTEVVYRPIYEATKYTVTLKNPNNSSETSLNNIVLGTNLSNDLLAEYKKDPAKFGWKEGTEFVGFSQDVSYISTDLDVTPKFIDITYQINFHHDSSYGPEIFVQDVNYSNILGWGPGNNKEPSIDMTPYTPQGMVFDGWCLASSPDTVVISTNKINGSNLILAPLLNSQQSSSLDLFPHFAKKTYELKIKYTGSDGINNVYIPQMPSTSNSYYLEYLSDSSATLNTILEEMKKVPKYSLINKKIVSFDVTGVNFNMNAIDGYSINTLYEDKKFLVTFQDYNDQLLLSDSGVLYDSKITNKPAPPPRNNFVFKGWAKNKTDSTPLDLNKYKVTSDTKLYAIYGDYEYTLTVNGILPGTTLTSYTSKFTLKTNTFDKLNAFKKLVDKNPNLIDDTHYDYTLTLSSNIVDNIMSGNATVTFNISPKTYVVNFVNDNNELIESKAVIYNNMVVSPNTALIYSSINKDMYVFEHFYDANSGSTTKIDLITTKITSNLTLKASYKIREISMTFYDHDGNKYSLLTGGVSSVPFKVKYGQTVSQAMDEYIKTNSTQSRDFLDKYLKGENGTIPVGKKFSHFTLGDSIIDLSKPIKTTSDSSSVNIYQKLADVTHSYIWLNNDGIQVKKTILKYSESLSFPSSMPGVPTGYKGVWYALAYTDSSGVFHEAAKVTDSTSNPHENIIYQYRHVITQKTITYEYQDATSTPVTKEALYDYNSLITGEIPDLATIDAYKGRHFLYWTYNPTGGLNPNDWIKYDFKTVKVVTNLTIKAKYEPKTYQVTFLDPEGTSLKVLKDLTYDALVPSSDIPTYSKVGYQPDGDGWKLLDGTPFDFKTTKITDNLIVKAAVKLSSYLCTFEVDGVLLRNSTDTEDFSLQGNIRDGVDLSKFPPEQLAKLVKTGHTFAGWDQSTDKITTHTKFTALFTKNSYVITINDEKGNFLKNITLEYGESLSLNSPLLPKLAAQDGMTFVGYNDGSSTVINSSSSLTIGDKNYTLKAEYVKHGATVKYAATLTNGSWKSGTAPVGGIIYYGDKLEMTSIKALFTAAAGYEFIGFEAKDGLNNPVNLDKINVGSVDPASTVITITPLFKLINFTVQFSQNGQILKDKTVVISGKDTKLSSVPTLTSLPGYDFVGWELEGVAGGPYEDLAAINTLGSIYTIYTSKSLANNTVQFNAVYTPQKFQINFYQYPSSHIGDNPIIKGELLNYGATIVEPTFIVATDQVGLAFKSWDKGVSPTVTGAANFYPVLSNKTYTVNYQVPTITKSEDLATNPLGFTSVYSNTTHASKVITYGDSLGDILNAYVLPNFAFTGYELFDGTNWVEVTKDDLTSGTGTLANVIKTLADKGELTIRLTYAVNTFDVTYSYEETDRVTTPNSIVTKTKTFTVNPYLSPRAEFNKLLSSTEPLTKINVDNKANYKHVGYSNDSLYFTKATTVFATYQQKNYNLKFFLNDAPLGTPMTIASGEVISFKDFIVPTGYTFKNWELYIDGTKTTVYAAGDLKPSAVSFNELKDNKVYAESSTYEFKAVCTKNTYRVSFFEQDGTTQIGATEMVPFGEAPRTVPTANNIPGLKFISWSENFDNITKDTKLTPIYASEVYYVDYYDEGVRLSQQTVGHGSKLSFPTIFKRPGYDFKGWKIKGTADSPVLNPDVTIQDKVLGFSDGATIFSYETVFEKQKFTVTVNYKEGNDLSKSQSDATIDYKGTYTLGDLIPEFYKGHHLIGFSCPFTSTGTGLNKRYVFSNILETTIITAQYETIKHEVLFKQNHPNASGTEVINDIKTQIFDEGGKIVPPTLTPVKGESFKGWYKDGDTSKTIVDLSSVSLVTDNPTSPTVNHTYIAYFTADTYTIKFYDNKLNSGTLLTSVAYKYHELIVDPYLDEAMKAKINNHLGLVFDGWDTNFSYADSSLEIYPTYRTKKYNVSYRVNGVEVKSELVSDKSSLAFPTTFNVDDKFDKTKFTWKKVSGTDGLGADIPTPNVGVTPTLSITDKLNGANVTTTDLETFVYDVTFALKEYDVKYSYLDVDGTTLKEISETTGTDVSYGLTANLPTIWDNSQPGTQPSFSIPKYVKNYVFRGFDKSNANITGDTVINATYTQKTITVNFNIYGSKTSITMNYGKVKFPIIPSIPGQTFESWRIDSTIGTIVDSHNVIIEDTNNAKATEVYTYAARFVPIKISGTVNYQTLSLDADKNFVSQSANLSNITYDSKLNVGLTLSAYDLVDYEEAYYETSDTNKKSLDVNTYVLKEGFNLSVLYTPIMHNMSVNVVSVDGGISIIKSYPFAQNSTIAVAGIILPSLPTVVGSSSDGKWYSNEDLTTDITTAVTNGEYALGATDTNIYTKYVKWTGKVLVDVNQSGLGTLQYKNSDGVITPDCANFTNGVKTINNHIHGETISLVDGSSKMVEPYYEGYTFVGWSTNLTSVGFPTKGATITITPLFIKENDTFTYSVSYGGTYEEVGASAPLVTTADPSYDSILGASISKKAFAYDLVLNKLPSKNSLNGLNKTKVFLGYKSKGTEITSTTQFKDLASDNAGVVGPITAEFGLVSALMAEEERTYLAKSEVVSLGFNEKVATIGATMNSLNANVISQSSNINIGGYSIPISSTFASSSDDTIVTLTGVINHPAFDSPSMPEIEMTRRITIDGTLATSYSIYTLFIERQQITKTQLLDALATYLTKVTKHQVVVNRTTLVSKSNNVLLTSNLNLKSSITFGDLGFLNSPDLKILDVTGSNLDSQGNITSSPDAGGANKAGSLTFKVNQTNANKLVKEFGATEVISITLNYSIQYLATKELDVHSKDLKADYNPYNLTTSPGFKTNIIGTPYMLGATAATADKKFEVTGTSITPSIYNTAPHTLIIPSRIDENYIKSVTGVAATNATLVVVSPGITHIPAGFINSALTRAIYLPSSLTSFDATSILSVNATKCHIYFATEDSKALYLKTLGLYSLENSSVSMPQLRTIDDNDPAQLGLNEIPYDYTQVAGGTVTTEMINAAKTNTTLAVNIYGRKVGDPLRTVGAPFMAYSPRTKFDESQASKEAHGVWKDVNGTNKLVELPNYASTLFSMTFNKDTNSFEIDLTGWVGGGDFENKNWPDTIQNAVESIMKPQVLDMVKKNSDIFKPVIDRGGYIADKTNAKTVIDPVNIIIPGLIRVADGDIEGVPAGDYPLERLRRWCIIGGSSSSNSASNSYNILTLSISENIKVLDDEALCGLVSINSLLFPSTLESGNLYGNFKNIGSAVTWQGEDNPLKRNTWSPDGPRATGLGTQPTDGGGTPSGTLPTSLIKQLYYPLSMPYYQKSLEMNGTTKKYEYGNPAGGLLENRHIGGITPQSSKYGGAHFPYLSAYSSSPILGLQPNYIPWEYIVRK